MSWNAVHVFSSACFDVVRIHSGVRMCLIMTFWTPNIKISHQMCPQANLHPGNDVSTDVFTSTSRSSFLFVCCCSGWIHKHVPVHVKLSQGEFQHYCFVIKGFGSVRPPAAHPDHIREREQEMQSQLTGCTCAGAASSTRDLTWHLGSEEGHCITNTLRDG